MENFRKRLQIAFFIICGLTSAPALSQPLTVGDPAPPLYIEEWIQPELIANSFDSLKQNRFILVDFWATWCSPCIAAFPHLNALSARYSDDVLFLSLASDSPEKVEKLLQRKPLDTYVGIDSFEQTFDAYNILAIPYSVLISPDQRILWEGHVDKLSPSMLAEYLEQSENVVKNNEDGSPVSSANDDNETMVIDQSTVSRFYTFTIKESVKRDGKYEGAITSSKSDTFITFNNYPVKRLIAYIKDIPHRRIDKNDYEHPEVLNEQLDVTVRSSKPIDFKQLKKELAQRLSRMYDINIDS